MKIFYGVAGEGMGHATRSRPLIQYLLKHHAVTVFAGGKALWYLQRWFPVIKIESTCLKYRENRISLLNTTVFNLIKFPHYIWSLGKVFAFMLRKRPDVVMTDFEPWTTWCALLLRIPVMSIHLPGHYLPPQPFLTNKQSLAQAGLKHHNFADRFWLWFITTLFIPYAHKVIIPSFFRIPVTDKRAVFVDPIIRDELKQRKNVFGDHVLVYQTAGTYAELMSVLKNFNDEKFIAYGFQNEGEDDNIVFKSFNEEEFFDDLCTAKGVITNGGISLMTEAVFLDKYILSLPIQGHGEQLVNAYFLEKEGKGITSSNISNDIVARFLKSVKRWKSQKTFDWKVERTGKIVEGLMKKLVKS